MPILILRIIGLILSLMSAVRNYKTENKSAVLGWICSSLLWANLIFYSLE